MGIGLRVRVKPSSEGRLRVGYVSDGVQSPPLREDLPRLGVSRLGEFGERAILASGAERLRLFLSSL
jgi:hypothetical protein